MAEKRNTLIMSKADADMLSGAFKVVDETRQRYATSIDAEKARNLIRKARDGSHDHFVAAMKILRNSPAAAAFLETQFPSILVLPLTGSGRSMPFTTYRELCRNVERMHKARGEDIWANELGLPPAR